MPPSTAWIYLFIKDISGGRGLNRVEASVDEDFLNPGECYRISKPAFYLVSECHYTKVFFRVPKRCSFVEGAHIFLRCVTEQDDSRIPRFFCRFKENLDFQDLHFFRLHAGKLCIFEILQLLVGWQLSDALYTVAILTYHEDCQRRYRANFNYLRKLANRRPLMQQMHSYLAKKQNK